jgi:tRNA 2-thiouridine synthesizing protein A
MAFDQNMRQVNALHRSEADPDSEPDNDDNSDSLPLRELRRLVGGACADCGRNYSAREAVFSIALGLQNAPRCLPCTSRGLQRDETEFRSDLRDYVHRRACYRKAWDEAERIDDVPPAEPRTSPPQVLREDKGESLSAAAEWDAGDMGCGELVMALRLRMQGLPAGTVIRVTATDPAAPEDLPAWCRLCGHTLVAMNHPQYWIRRKGD